MTADRHLDLAPIVKRIVVNCRVDAAFRYFTADFERWWPGQTHSVIAMSTRGAERPAACTFDARPGGRIIERGANGDEFVWGTVLVWEPPHRIAFSWHPGRDPKEAQTVEVTFAASGSGTEVVLTHSGWERLAERAAAVRDSYDNGWESVFGKAYREYADEREA